MLHEIIIIKKNNNNKNPSKITILFLQMNTKLYGNVPAFVLVNKDQLHYIKSQIPLLHILSTKNTTAPKSCSI